MMPEVKKILYATDLSQNTSSLVFSYAVDLAKRFNAQIVILHSIENIRYMGDDGISIELGEMLEEAKRQERKTNIEEINKRIEAFCKRTETQVGFSCTQLVSKILVPQGNPVDEILKAADEEGCDVIVLGPHKKGFLKEAFLGSVTRSVLERTSKPVFVVPMPSK